jgi:hypothetical protein
MSSQADVEAELAALKGGAEPSAIGSGEMSGDILRSDSNLEVEPAPDGSPGAEGAR